MATSKTLTKQLAMRYPNIIGIMRFSTVTGSPEVIWRRKFFLKNRKKSNIFKLTIKLKFTRQAIIVVKSFAIISTRFPMLFTDAASPILLTINFEARIPD